MSKKYDLKFKNSKKLAKIKSLEVEEKELTRSPISGTYILKDWNNDLKCVKEKMKQFSNEAIFSKSEVALNSIAASFVEITPQAKARLEKIPNKIGPYECKLCKVVYVDAFELAMHNCPRVVHMEYKCSECGKVFNCPANLASHKRWHKPKNSIFVNQTSKGEVSPCVQNKSKYSQSHLIQTQESANMADNARTCTKHEPQSNQNTNNQIHPNSSFYSQLLFKNYAECYGTQLPALNINSIDCINQYLYSNLPLIHSSSGITSDQISSLFTQFYSNYFTAATTNFLSRYPIGMSFPISTNPTLTSVQFSPFDQSNIN